jgi:hypothetical protein
MHPEELTGWLRDWKLKGGDALFATKPLWLTTGRTIPAVDAVKEVHRLIGRGYTDVVRRRCRPGSSGSRWRACSGRSLGSILASLRDRHASGSGCRIASRAWVGGQLRVVHSLAAEDVRHPIFIKTSRRPAALEMAEALLRERYNPPCDVPIGLSQC